MNLADRMLLLDIFKKMARIRVIELYIAERYPEEIMRTPTHLSLGQEAPAAVLGALVELKDIFFGSYRAHGQYLAKGGNLKALFAELLGRADGCSGGMGGSPHIIDRVCGFFGSTAIVGGHIPIAGGAAFAERAAGHGGVVVCFLGDAAMEEGVMYETVNFALLFKLPILFVCENNRQCVTTPMELRTTHEELYKRFEPMALPSMRVSGTNVPFLLHAAQAMLEIPRSGKGPAFLECEVERWAIHVGHTYEGPVEAWWQNPAVSEADHCPLARTARLLLEAGVVTLGELAELHAGFRGEAEETFISSQASPLPTSDVLQTGVYASGLTSILPAKKEIVSYSHSAAHEPSKLVNPY